MSLFTSEAMFKARRAQCQAKPPAKSFDICSNQCMTLSLKANCGRCGNKCKQTESCVAATSGSFPYVCAAAAPPQPPVWTKTVTDVQKNWTGMLDIEMFEDYRKTCGNLFRPQRTTDPGPLTDCRVDDRGNGFEYPKNFCFKPEDPADTWGLKTRIYSGACVPKTLDNKFNLSTTQIDNLTSGYEALPGQCNATSGRLPFTDEVPDKCKYWTLKRETVEINGVPGYPVVDKNFETCGTTNRIIACIKD